MDKCYVCSKLVDEDQYHYIAGVYLCDDCTRLAGHRQLVIIDLKHPGLLRKSLLKAIEQMKKEEDYK